MYCGPEFFGWHGWFGFPFGWLFIGLMVWLLVSVLRRDKPVSQELATCSGCSRSMDASWTYCPVCGKSA